LVVKEFPGYVWLFESSSPVEVRGLARSVAIADRWFTCRSYRNQFGLLAANPSRVGVDMEFIDVSVTADAVLTRDEARIAAGPMEWCAWWSAKESLAKALGDARLYDPRRLESPALWPLGRLGRWRAEQLDVPTGHVGWVVWETEHLAC
jgi:hypothetical protein